VRCCFMQSFLNEFLPHRRRHRARNRRTIACVPGQQHPWIYAAHLILLSANEAARPDSAKLTAAVRRAAYSAIAGPHHFAQAVHGCPLRLVLADDLTRCSTALAYAEGGPLSGCLDLVRVPSERLWVEWSESPRVEALSAILETHIKPPVTGGRAGALVNSDASGRSGTIRSFWSTPDDRVYCAQLITEFDLNLPIRGWNHSIAEVFNGESTAVYEGQGSAFDALLTHIRFRFDPAWVDHYRLANLSTIGNPRFSAPHWGTRPSLCLC